MTGTGIRSAFDCAIPAINAIDPLESALVDLPIAQYGLDRPHVLDAIAALAKQGSKNPVRAYNAQGAVPLPAIAPKGLDELFWHSRQSTCTFNIEHVERYVPEVCAMAVDFTATFGGTVAVHAFVTAGGVPATPLHYDYSNAFTFQLCGTKWWQCFAYHDTPVYDPSGYRVNPAAVGGKTLDRVLQPGECLFIPQGGLHLVTALADQDSLHLAVSVKALTYHRYMSQLLDPSLELDHPPWIGTRFAEHVRRIAEGATQVGALAASGDVSERARHAVWGLIYEGYNAATYPLPQTNSTTGQPSRYCRSTGRPLSVVRRPDCIAVELLDPEPGPVGNFGFRPALVELPTDAEAFVAMLEAGALDVEALRAAYDTSTVNDLLNLAVDLGIFHAQ